MSTTPLVAPPDRPHLTFQTQLPRDDGCGVVVLSMLTGKPYGEVAAMIDWKGKVYHHTSWPDLRGVLAGLGWQMGEITPVTFWNEVHGMAIVHVMPDHFMLFDEDSGLYYDPGQAEGPQHMSMLQPLCFVTVAPSSV